MKRASVYIATVLFALGAIGYLRQSSPRALPLIATSLEQAREVAMHELLTSRLLGADHYCTLVPNRFSFYPLCSCASAHARDSSPKLLR